MSRADDMWELLKVFGIETREQFEEAYKKCPKIDITAFVPARVQEEKTSKKKGA